MTPSRALSKEGLGGEGGTYLHHPPSPSAPFILPWASFWEQWTTGVVTAAGSSGRLVLSLLPGTLQRPNGACAWLT